MRQNLSKGMIVAGCATTLLSLWGIPALADSRTDASTAEAPDTLPGHSAADAPAAAPAKADVAPAYGAQGADRSAEHGAAGKTSEHGAVGKASDPGRTGGQRGVDGYGDDSGAGRGAAQGDTSVSGQTAGHGDTDGVGHVVGQGVENVSEIIAGHGDAGGSDSIAGHGAGSGQGDVVTGGYGDDETPPMTPPTPQPTSPPRVVTPPKPAHDVHTPAPRPSTPPAARPERPSSLAQTGVGSETMAASGVAAFLMASGVVFYRRGRAGSCR
ncbi:hypothetical protein [Streptomyces sp. NPDC048385]|uniref:hypothetical protein n=1 Tax=unclassified Streptomyces TaxID=2593676 RepID=UPI003415BBEC